MKEKLGVVLIVIIAALSFFGCSEELPEEEMVQNIYTNIGFENV